MHPVTLTRPFSTLTPRDLRDDATYTTRSRTSTSFKARLFLDEATRS
jgi:hypothetical protein